MNRSYFLKTLHYVLETLKRQCISSYIYVHLCSLRTNSLKAQDGWFWKKSCSLAKVNSSQSKTITLITYKNHQHGYKINVSNFRYLDKASYKEVLYYFM